MRKPIWESEWHGLKFSDVGVSTSIFSRAGRDFYDGLYDELFARYDSLESLPDDWRKQKLEVAAEIRKLYADSSSILSIGCGLGFIEKVLCNDLAILNFDVFDSSQLALRWIKDEIKVKTLSDLKGHSRYDFVFCVQLCYALTDQELLAFAKVVRSKLNEGGLFLTVDSSSIPAENGLSSRPDSLSKIFIRLARDIAAPGRNSQFWGWLRDNEGLAKNFTSSGLVLESRFFAVGQTFQLFRAC